jgi:hypothetical protein
LVALHPLAETHQVLHVVPELVGNDVGLREVAGRPETSEVAEESEIKIHLPIPGTVERAGGRLCRPARRVDRISEQHDNRPLVTPSKEPFPCGLGVVRDGVDEVHHPLLLRRRLHLPGRAGVVLNGSAAPQQ